MIHNSTATTQPLLPPDGTGRDNRVHCQPIRVAKCRSGVNNHTRSNWLAVAKWGVMGEEEERKGEKTKEKQRSRSGGGAGGEIKPGAQEQTTEMLLVSAIFINLILLVWYRGNFAAHRSYVKAEYCLNVLCWFVNEQFMRDKIEAGVTSEAAATMRSMIELRCLFAAHSISHSSH
ncbi:hypothetical protein RRG08_003521 [Elysia crispata]|uniref:Uncharacterized protein n=1 Tax=Elysia crispata TaxID=231223 RepID=A0AAE0Y6W3_9GAST|nr:hypothetical protein RRG08_003521 [Elysia crispata]